MTSKKRYRVDFVGESKELREILSSNVKSVYDEVSDARKVARAVRDLFGDTVRVDIFSREPGSKHVARIDPFPREGEQ